jgi:hypothetical protein
LAYAAHSYSRLPSSILQDQWMKFIAETGQPELIQELNHGPIPKDANYKILKRVDIDRKKRPNRDMVACPMCYAKNKFLRGSLVFLYDLNTSAVIGRCCADNVDMAERAYNADRLLRWQEDYLLDALPYVTEKIETVNQLRPFAEELQRIHRKIRRDASSFHGTLRSLKDRNNARISLFENVEGPTDHDYVGPAGFAGARSKRGAREIFFGALRGTTVAIHDYKPVVELDDVQRNLSVFDFAKCEDSIVDFISGLSAKDRKVAVAALQIADKNFAKFERRARDVLEFFSRENIATLNEFGAHNLNPAPFSIELRPKGPKRNLSINSTIDRCFVVIDAQIFELAHKWTEIAYRKFDQTE